MMPKPSLPITGLMSVVVLSSLAGCKEAVTPHPNVLLICVDDMNGYGITGEYPLCKAPYLNKLKNESIVFRNAVCNSPVSNPSRSSFFSGLYPSTTGAYLNGSDGWNRSELLKEIRCIPETFKDNGYHCGEKLRWEKATLWEKAGNVPFMVRTPDRTKAESGATISLADIYPTLIEYCRLKKPDQQFDGHSFAYLLKKPQAKWKVPGFTTYGVEYSSIRTERYRYIRYPDGVEELYDHEKDPHEFKNIASDPAMENVLKKLRKHLPKSWAPSTGGRLEVPRNMEKVMRPPTPWDNEKTTS